MRLLSLALVALALFCAPKSQAQTFTQTIIGVDRTVTPSPVCIMSPLGACATELGTWDVGTGAWTAFGASTPGTVTSVNITLPLFTFAGCPITSSGTCVGSLNTQSANLVLAGPASGSPTAPSFRALSGADLPPCNAASIGSVPATGGGTAAFLRADCTFATPAGGGNVSNVGTPTNNQLAQWTGSTTLKGITAGTGVVTALQVAANAVGGFLTTPGGACTSGQFLTFLTPGGVPTCLTPAGSGNVSTSGTPSLGQIAEWINATTVQGATLGAGLKITGSTITAPGLTSVYDVTNATYGCASSSSTGAADQATCIQSVINAAYSAGGGVVWVPVGFWNLKSQLNVKQNVVIQCANNGAVYDASTLAYGSTSKGSIFSVLWGSGSWVQSTAAVLLDTNAAVRDCGFWYPSQSASAASPTVYGSTVLLNGVGGGSNTNQEIARNYFANSYAAIDLRGSIANLGVGRIKVYENTGAGIAYNVLINYMVDWSSIHDNNWNSGEIWASDPTPNSHLRGWIASNGVEYFIQHSDWVQLTHEQGYGYITGVYLDFSTACCGPFTDTGPVVLSQVQFDGNFNGVLLQGGSAQSITVNNSVFTPFNVATNGQGPAFINVPGTTVVSLNFSNNYIFGPAQAMIASSGTITNSVITGNSMASSGTALGSCVYLNAGTQAFVTQNVCTGGFGAFLSPGTVSTVYAPSGSNAL